MIKTYEAIFDEEQNTGVYGISLVENPAMEGLFIALNTETKLQFKELNKEERKVVGLVLEPNKPIYRNNQGEEYNIVFSEQTIKNLSYNFFKQNFQKNSTIEHDTESKIENVTFVESWIVEDEKQDKQNLYGFKYPKGSWLAVLKIDNEDIWNNYVKTGNVKGFSIDGLLSLKEVNFKTEIEMNKEVLEESTKQTSLLSQILAAFSTPKEEVVLKFGSVKTADGSVTIEYDGEELVAGSAAWIMADDETKVPVPVGEHPLEDGKILVVTEEGIIAEVKEEVAKEEAPAEPSAEPMSETAKDDANMVKEIESAIKSIMIKYSAIEERLNGLETANVELKKDNEVLKVALSETPAKKPIKSSPSQNTGKFSSLLNKLNN